MPAPTLVRLLLLLLQCATLFGCASLPAEPPRQPSTAWAAPQQTELGQLLLPSGAAAARGDSGFRLLGAAQDALGARLALIQASSRTLDLQYYAIHADQSTELLIAQLRHAARRGVRVRILLDDLNSVGRDAQVMALSFEKNVEVRMFNPLTGPRASVLTRAMGSLLDAAQAQRRMHNKLFIADNAMAIAGGRNLGDAYFGRDASSNFVDLDLLASGVIVPALSASFDRYWNDPLAYPVEALISPEQLQDLKARSATAATAGALAPPEPSAPQPHAAPQVGNSAAALRWLKPGWTWAPAIVLADKPDKLLDDTDADAQDTVVDGLLQLMGQARHDVLVVSAYFVPGQRLMDVFAALVQRGVRVRVLTNSLASSDSPLAHAGYARYRVRLLALGVELYELRSEQTGRLRGLGSAAGSSSSLHAKAVVLDGRTLVIGSMNLDLRSLLYNTEVALVVRSGALAAQAVQAIAPTLRDGAYRLQLADGQLLWQAPGGAGPVDSRGEPDTSLTLRLVLGLLGPFAPEELL